MANEIVTQVDVLTFEKQSLSVEDTSLLTTFTIDGNFNSSVDNVELYVYDTNKTLVSSNYNYNGWRTYQETSPANVTYIDDLIIDPVLDANQEGLYSGTSYLVYEFTTNELITSSENRLFITSISGDRLVVDLESVDDIDFTTLVSDFKSKLNASDYFKEIYLNFGDNKQVIAVNIRSVGSTIQFKLYEPLPDEFQLKSTCWVQTRIADPVAYSVEFSNEVVLPDTRIFIKGPNQNLTLAEKNGGSTVYQNKQQLLNATGSLTAQLQSILNEKGVEINIDYSDFANFVHFSTATQRLYNYQDKVNGITAYSASIAAIKTGGTGTYLLYESASAEIIKNFDGYEYYLYFDQNLTSSAYLQTWLGTPGWEGTGMLATASRYDMENPNNLVYSLPQFIREDASNDPAIIFTEMLGQYFDIFYLYTKGLSDRYNADNRLNYGISKGLVADALKSFGVKLYENNFSSDDLYSALIGLTPTGSLPNSTIQTGSLLPGQQWIDTVITVSDQVIPLQDLNLSIYKRLYHNLPLLVKRKGTLAGLQQLITLYGLPDTILRVYEFGGKDKNNNTWDFYQNNFSYCLTGSSVSQVDASFDLNPTWNATNNVPAFVAFKFQTQASGSTQTLFETSNGVRIDLTPHTPSVAPGTFIGQPLDPYYQYATASLVLGTDKLNVFLPFYDGNWWTLAASYNGSATYRLYAKAITTNGIDGNTINFSAFDVKNSAFAGWPAGGTATWTVDGAIKEARYYSEIISQSIFDAFVTNPDSVEAPSKLAFRAALGGELFTGSYSIHPAQTTSSFVADSNFTYTGYFTGSVETAFYNQVPVGIQNAVSNKVQITGSQAYGKVLSSYISLEQPSTEYTKDVNYVEVGFSPSNEVNEDISNELGFFNIGDYIGDPKLQFEGNFNYPALEVLQREYFAKYTSNYDIYDYLNLIQYFDNSLFQIIQDFVPARTALASGAIIKQNQLERNRLRPASASREDVTLETTVKSSVLDYETGSLCIVTGGPAGSVNEYNNDTQAWSASLYTKAGVVNVVETSRYEFYNGEFSGSAFEAIQGELQDNPILAPRYVTSIADEQTLYVSRTSNYNGISASFGLPMSGTLPFNLEIVPTDRYSTTTYQFNPLFLVQGDVQINITGAFINTTSTEDSQLTVYLKENGYIVATGFDDNGNNNDLSIKISIPDFTVQPNATYQLDFLYTENDNPGFSRARIDSSSFWSMTVDDLSAQSAYYNDPTVFSQQNFPGSLTEYGDYYALYNNVYSNRASQFFYDVDYQNGIVYPTNFIPIVSQSAIFAQTQDSNYAISSSWQRNRYAGIKLSGRKLNEYTPGDISYGQTPVQEQTTAYMIYYDWAGSTLAQRLGSANYHIAYLIDENGTLFKPEASASYEWNMLQAFGQNAPVSITTYNAGASLATSVETTSYRPLSQLKPILYSSTGSLGNPYLVSGSYNTIALSASAALLPYAENLNAIGGNIGIGPGIYTASFDTVTQDTQGGLNTATSIYTHPQDAAPIRYTVRVDCDYEELNGTNSTVRTRIYKNTNIISDSGIQNLPAGSTRLETLIVDTTILPGDTIYVRIITTSSPDINVGNTINIKPVTTAVNINNPYWTVGASSRNVLTSSVTLGTYYGGGYQQHPIINSGFDTPLQWKLETYDQIRFESNENKVYLIVSSSFDAANNRVYAYLNNATPIGTNINDFSISRLIFDPGFIILNYQRGVGPGFIIPKYPSPKLKQNLSMIIKDFAEKNLL